MIRSGGMMRGWGRGAEGGKVYLDGAGGGIEKGMAKQIKSQRLGMGCNGY